MQHIDEVAHESTETDTRLGQRKEEQKEEKSENEIDGSRRLVKRRPERKDVFLES